MEVYKINQAILFNWKDTTHTHKPRSRLQLTMLFVDERARDATRASVQVLQEYWKVKKRKRKRKRTQIKLKRTTHKHTHTHTHTHTHDITYWLKNKPCRNRSRRNPHPSRAASGRRCQRRVRGQIPQCSPFFFKQGKKRKRILLRSLESVHIWYGNCSCKTSTFASKFSNNIHEYLFLTYLAVPDFCDCFHIKALTGVILNAFWGMGRKFNFDKTWERERSEEWGAK